MNNILTQTPLLVMTSASALKRFYLIFHGEKHYAELEYHKWYSNKCILRMKSGEIWEFIPIGIFENKIEIRNNKDNFPLAVFNKNYFSKYSVLNLPKGEKLNFHYNVMRSKLRIESESGSELALVEHKGIFKSRFLVYCEKELKIFGSYPWILPFGCYFVSLHQRHS